MSYDRYTPAEEAAHEAEVALAENARVTAVRHDAAVKALPYVVHLYAPGLSAWVERFPTEAMALEFAKANGWNGS